MHGCAIMREAAVRLSLYEHALKQVAKERDTMLAQLKRLGRLHGLHRAYEPGGAALHRLHDRAEMEVEWRLPWIRNTRPSSGCASPRR